MRLIPLLFAVFLPACHADQELRATQIAITPRTVTVDTASSIQLQTTVSWSDGAPHPAHVTFQATGGTVSEAGIYQAGTVAGRYAVIATCTCGPVDTAAIVITEPPQPPSVSPPLASLTVAVAGLPLGTPAQISITGHGGYARSISATTTLDSLPADGYVVKAAGVATDAGSYSPTPDSQSTILAAGEIKTVQVTYSAPAPIGLPPHPRVWMTAARITQLQAQAAANTTRWQKVKAAADAQLKPGAGTAADMLPALCLAYLATGNVQYAQRAGVILVANTDSAATASLHSDSAYPYRSVLPLMSEGLDWCYAGLTVAQRQRAATWLMDAADWVWPESNPARNGAWAVNAVTNNYYWGFMMTGPAALAAAGDDTGTGTISGGDRPTYHQQLALRRWTAQALPYFAADGLGGAGQEGTGYDTSSRIALFANAFQTAGLPVSTPWLAQTMQWHLHATMPGGLFFAPLGDQPRVSNAPMYIYNREAMLNVMAAANAGSDLNAQAQRWLTLIGQVPYSPSDGSGLANELLYYDPSAPSAPDLGGLPKGYLAAGAGDFIYRQSWTDPNATVLVFESGSLLEGHSADDANGLMIWKGDFWISASANIYSYSGIEQATADYNNLTIGGKGQSNSYPNNRGEVTATQMSDALVVVRGQAKDAYNPASARPVTDYLRTVAYLPQQDAFVIVDRATVKDPSQTKVWRWQMQGVPDVNGTSFRLQNPSGRFRCFGNVLSPADVVLGVQTYALGSSPASTTSNAVTVTVPPGRSSDVVVTVLQCTDAMAAPFTPVANITAAGTDVLIGGTHVVIPADETQAVYLQ